MEITQEEYYNRRRLLVEEFWKDEENRDKPLGILIETAPELEMGPGNPYRYRPGTELYYYTGWEEPEAVMLMVIQPDLNFETKLWVQPKDPSKEIWTGPRLNLEEARKVTYVNQTYPMNDEGLEKLQGYLNEIEYLGYHGYNSGEGRIWKIVNDKKSVNISLLIDRLRLVKSPAEIARLEEVCKISANAFIQLMRKTCPSIKEAYLDALFHFEVMKYGCPRLAYPNIVGSGINSTILHYEKNNGVLRNGELVLVDAGGEKNMTAADITRTWPVNGQFSQAQREVYELVLRAQKTCIDMVKPGTTLNQLQDKVFEIYREGLTTLGVITPEDSNDEEIIKKFYPHSVGHWLGMEVHDCFRDGEAQKEIAFRPGFVLTVEPGLYFPYLFSVPEKYRGIGVRIEDDIVVTEDGCRVLSAGAPKEIAEIEKIIGINS